MAINLPRYADDDAADLVNGAYSQAMAEIEKNLDKASTDSTAANTKADAASAAAEQAKTKAEQAYTYAEQANTKSDAASAAAEQANTKSDAASATAEQAKTSVLGQKNEIDKLRGDVDGLIAGGGEATVPIATTSKAGIVKPDGSTISVQVDGTVSLADNSVNSAKLAAAAVDEDKLSEGVKAKLNKPSVEPYTLPVATTAALGGVKSGGDIIVGSTGTMTVGTAAVTETKLSADVQAKLNKETGLTEVPDNSVTSDKIVNGAVTETKLSTEVQTKLNKTAPAYSLPVATTTVLGGVKSGGDINVDSTGNMTVGSAAITTAKISDAAVTETKLSADVQAKLNKETGLTEVPDNSVTSDKIVNGAVTETKLSTEVQTKLNKTAPAYSLPVATTTVLGGVKSGGDIIVGSTGTMTVGGSAVTTDKISEAAVTETKLSADVQAKLNKPAVEPYTLPVATNTTLGGIKTGGHIYTDSGGIAYIYNATATTIGGIKLGTLLSATEDGTVSLNNNSVTEAKLSTEVQAKLNRSAPAYSLPVASTSRLGGVKAGRDINIDSSGLMTIGSGMIEESQLSSSVQNKLNKSGETISAELININTNSYGGSNCHGFKFGDLIILNIQARNLSGSSGIKIGTMIYAYTPRQEMSGPCVCGNGLGQFVIRTNGDIIINPKGYGPDGFFTCTYVA